MNLRWMISIEVDLRSGSYPFVNPRPAFVSRYPSRSGNIIHQESRSVCEGTVQSGENDRKSGTLTVFTVSYLVSTKFL